MAQPKMAQTKIRAHGNSGDGLASVAGLPGVLGVRREDKNKWERRAPIAPAHAKQLVDQGIRVLVQPSNRRIFTDEEYRDAGAVVQEDLTECSTILAVKEVPVSLLLPGKNWMFFSHTIKAQPANMPLLDAMLEKKVRFIDYECITETGRRGGPRLVAFGKFAGNAGAVDCLRGLGERLLALGFMTPLLHIGAAFMYSSLEESCRAIALAGEAIRANGLPQPLCPFTVVFTGSGNVTTGALEIFKLLPHEMITPKELPKLTAHPELADNHKVYIVVVKAEDMVRRRDGQPFNKQLYYDEPDAHESTFQDMILPHCTTIVNGMYWDPRFPRLFTSDDLANHVRLGQDKLLAVCDITCDENGSVPTRQFSSIERPYYIYNALTDQVSDSLDSPGVLFHAVDHLPSELPREASEHFGHCLLPFLPALVGQPAPKTPGGASELPLQLRGAVITEGGALTREYQYIQQLRSMNQEGDDTAYLDAREAVSAHGELAPPAVARLDLIGHLFDTKLINQVTDIVETAHARLQVLNLAVGSSVTDESSMSLLVMAQTGARLEQVVQLIGKATIQAKGTMRRIGSDGNVLPERAVPRGVQSAAPDLPPRRVLIFGAGFVVPPLVEYLLRRPENLLVIASVVPIEVNALADRFGKRVKPVVHDILAMKDSDASNREQLVKEADLVISLIPATMHARLARLSIKHKKHMVTASYVSPEMESLDQEARDAGVLIINEVGLDPGIDHMSAMKMIDAVKAEGARILSFSSLCGGLPSPEAAGSSPLGYKFSWSPAGVLRASQNPALWKEHGRMHEVKGEDLLTSAKPMLMNNAFAFDVLPNRDSTAFAELYGIADAPTFFRGTFRYRGFCERMAALAQLGLLDVGPRPELSSQASLRQWLAKVLRADSDDEAQLRAMVGKKLGPSSDLALSFMTWLGLFSSSTLPKGSPAESPLEVLAKLLQREEMLYGPQERDMVAMQHELVVEKAGQRIRHSATLIEYGIPHGETAMARTVGLTAAIAAQLVMDEPGNFGVGVQRPLRPEWYNPVLARLEGEGIRLKEHSGPEASSKL